MELGKIGDQNVEFFKGHLILFCATKLVQPFKRYGHSKMEKGEKKSIYEKFQFLPLSFVFNAFFSFSLPCLVWRAVLGAHLAAWSGLFERGMMALQVTSWSKVAR